MKIILPKGLLAFDLPANRLSVLPKHIAWFQGRRIREIPDADMHVSGCMLRPFTTLEMWLIDIDVCPTRLRTAFVFDGRGRKNPLPFSYWKERARMGMILTTTAELPAWQTHVSTVKQWLKRRKLTPPSHIFSPAHNFVAEELPRTDTYHINAPATHAN